MGFKIVRKKIIKEIKKDDSEQIKIDRYNIYKVIIIKKNYLFLYK